MEHASSVELITMLARNYSCRMRTSAVDVKGYLQGES